MRTYPDQYEVTLQAMLSEDPSHEVTVVVGSGSRGYYSSMS